MNARTPQALTRERPSTILSSATRIVTVERKQSGSEHHPEWVVKETLTFSTNPGRSQGEVLGIDVALYPDAG